MSKIKVEYYLGITIVVILTLSGCNLLASSQAPTSIPDVAYTAAAETIIAQLTQVAPAVPTIVPPSIVPSPTMTLLLTEIPQISPTETILPTESVLLTLTDTPTDIPEILFEDDFSYDTGWYTDKDEDFSFEYVEDGYLITVDILNAPIWSIRERNFSDVRVEVDAVQLSGPQDGYYGVVCRHHDSDNYFALVIESDGDYGIAKSENGEFEFLKTGTAPEGVINIGEAVNRVRADCVGESITLYANEQKLLEVRDDDFESGYIGVIAGTRLSGGIEVLFDNFAIYEP